MNGGGDHDDDWKDVMTDPEILDSAALGCIESLRRKRVCFYPGPHVPPQPGEITDFGQCVPYLGACNALIFCAPHQTKEEARAKVLHYLAGGDPALVFDLHECVTDYDFIWRDDLLFPHKIDKLLVARPGPNTKPESTRPPDSQFWANYVVLSIVDRGDKLHLLHLGLRGEHAWPYFVSPHGIKVSSTITNPPW